MYIRRFLRLPSLLLLLPLAMISCGGGTEAPAGKPPPAVNRNHAPGPGSFAVERLSTVAPFPRGLEEVDGKLYVLCRGRVRGAGGVSAEIEDQAGTIYEVDPDVVEALTYDEPSGPVRANGKVLAVPTAPPFRLWDRRADPPESDRLADRPYCALRYHAATKSFYICAFSGIDKASVPGASSFSKNLTDGILRYDLRTRKWYEVERHDVAAGGNYPHHDPAYHKPPHGWLSGPDNCLVAGNSLYAVAKDNSLLIRYDLTPLIANPEAGFPESEFVLGPDVWLKSGERLEMRGHSALAAHGGYLYVASRTSSHIIRIALDSSGLPVQPIEAELVARFSPFDPGTGKSANLTDMAFDSGGFLYVISALPSRIYRFRPDPGDIYDATFPHILPWANLAKATGNDKMKSENIFIDSRDRIFVTSGDGYGYQNGAKGTVYRVVEKR